MAKTYLSVVKERSYILSPTHRWWNPNGLVALKSTGIRLITRQSSIGDVLNAMGASGRRGMRREPSGEDLADSTESVVQATERSC
jgi:hypothetical protein